MNRSNKLAFFVFFLTSMPLTASAFAASLPSSPILIAIILLPFVPLGILLVHNKRTKILEKSEKTFWTFVSIFSILLTGLWLLIDNSGFVAPAISDVLWIVVLCWPTLIYLAFLARVLIKDFRDPQ